MVQENHYTALIMTQCLIWSRNNLSLLRCVWCRMQLFSDFLYSTQTLTFPGAHQSLINRSVTMTTMLYCW